MATNNIPAVDAFKHSIRPMGFNILVGLPPKESKIGSIIIPDATSDRERLAQIKGRLLAMSPAAFDFADFPEGARPVVGDAVMFAKYGGTVLEDENGNEMRLLLDKDLTAVLEESADA